jgi:hypothetical protein
MITSGVTRARKIEGNVVEMKLRWASRGIKTLKVGTDNGGWASGDWDVVGMYSDDGE